MDNPYEFDNSDRMIWLEERIAKMLKEMAEDQGLRCTECGGYLFDYAEEVDGGVHRLFTVYIEEGEYGEQDKIHILCNKCAKELKWL